MWQNVILYKWLSDTILNTISQEPTESANTGPWLADNQSRDLNNTFPLVVYLIRSVAAIGILNPIDIPGS